MKQRILLLLMVLFASLSYAQQIGITSFRVKSTLPADISVWAKDPTALVLIANKIPFQKVGANKLVLQIKSNGQLICGYQPEEVAIKDSSFRLSSFSAKELTSMLPKCKALSPGEYQLSARFFNAQNEPISKESSKPFTVTADNNAATASACTSVLVSNQLATCHGTDPATGNPAYATITSITNNSGQQITSWSISSTDVAFLGSPTPNLYQGTPVTLGTGVNSIGAIMFSNPAPMPIYFNYTFTFADGTQCTVKVTVDYTACGATTSCSCNPWPSQIKYVTSTYGAAPFTYYSISNGGTITLNTNLYIDFPNLAGPNCSGTSCAQTLTYKLYAPDNTEIDMGGGSFFNSGTLWEQPCSNTGKYKIVISAKCGTTSCSDYVVYVSKPCPPCPTCTLTTKFFQNSSWTTLSTTTATTINCNQTIDINNTIVCTPANSGITNGSLQATLYDANNNTPTWLNTSSLQNNLLIIPANVSGNYFLKYTWGLASGNCGSAIYPITITCQPPACTCGQWTSLNVNGTNSYTCGATINWPCNTKFQFSTSLSCNPTNCAPPVYAWNIKYNGSIIMQGTNFPAIAPKFTPTNDGVYILTINGSCNGVVCTSCVYTINVTGCITLPLCNFLPVAFQGQTICTGASTTIGMAPEAGITYSWTSNPIGFTSTLSNPTVNPTVTTTYTLSRTNANPACPAKTATQIITVAPCCDPTCRPSLAVKNLVTNQITICNTTTTMQLNCGQSYDFTRTLTCYPANSNIIFKQLSFQNSLGQPVSWAGGFLGAGVLTIPTTAPSGNYQVIYTWGTTGQVCGDSTYTFNVSCVPPDCCSGSYWKEPLSVFDAAGVKLQTLSCNVPGTIININPALNNCDKPLTIKGLFVCNTSNCASKVEYVLSNNSGVVVTGTNSLVIPANLPNGNYILSYIAYCGAKICETCKIEVFKNCPPACDCGKWDKLNITGTTNNYICGDGITADCNKDFKFNINYNCAPTSANCLADIKWEIKNGAVQVAQGGGASPAFGSFTPIQNGTYILSLTAICNGQVCPLICTYKIVVNNCCEPKIVKVTDGNGNPVTPNQICVTPGSYNAQLDPTAPVVSGTYIATVLPNGAILNSGAFTSTASQTITVPQYICGQKDKIRIEYKWNNNKCSAVWEKPICIPYTCCENINFVNSTKTLSGTNVNFTTNFSVAAPGTTINKVKVQLLEVSVAGAPRPNANILTLSGSGGLGTGIVNPAITTPGTAIWFTPTTPVVVSPGNITFSGTLINVGTVSGLTLRIRYTFYQANGACTEWICEKDVL